jgi:nicotinamide mononucleotide adenylyltransferase
MQIEIIGLKSLDNFLNESKISNAYVVGYGGKFQPFHCGHFDIYEKLIKKFGKDNVYITTTDTQVYDEKHIMNFDEKKMVMTKMFKIPNNKIVKVKNNYAPKELTGMFTPETAYITIVGEKDAERLGKGGKYFEEYKDGKEMQGYFDRGYFYVEQNSPGVNISATEIRDFFRGSQDEEEMEKYFKKIYGKFDAQVFNLLVSRLHEGAMLYPRGWKEMDGIFLNPDSLILWTVNEGGAFGHLEHIYDDLSLSFDNLRELVDLGLEGKLENAVEKTDGQALAISWKNGGLISARNKGHYKNFGENALDYASLKSQFEGRGDIADAFSFAIDDLQNALSKLSSKDLDSLFENGKKFMHLEVMYVPTTNTVPYNINLIVFHNITEYDNSGEPVNQDRKSADKLAKMIETVNQNVQKTFKIQGSPYIDMKAISDLNGKKQKFYQKINAIQSKYKLGNSNTLLDYYENEWKDLLSNNSIKLTDIEIEGLITRWCKEEKSGFMLTAKNLSAEALEWAKEFEKSGLKDAYGKIKRPVELLFVELAVTILGNLKTFLAANPEESAVNIKKELESTISQIKSENDESALSKMGSWLERLEAAGGSENIFPSEGVVFDFKGKIYKLTGTFTDVHHIISILKYKK